MVYRAVSKTAVRKDVWVRVPPRLLLKIEIMGKPKKVNDISAADYIKIKLKDKEILNNALKNGENINDVAIKRGIKLVQPI
jgi:hypothetical protein